jgi:glycosyltransferase involved in cell wall biosynthesis
MLYGQENIYLSPCNQKQWGSMAESTKEPSLPLVSIIIPAYNAERFIGETLRSVLLQTYQNIEIVVVDDGSTDDTAAIVRQFAEQDQRIILIQQSNTGVAAARNCAIRHSHGEFVAPIDSDDIWYPHKIEKQVECFLHASADTGLVYTWSAHIDEEGCLTGGYNAGDREGSVLVDLVYRDFIGNGSVPLIRRTYLDVVGGYNKSLRDRGAQGCEDWELALRVAERYKFLVVAEFLVGYRQAFGSMSSLGIAMEQSYSLTAAYIKQNHPEIPRVVYKWSKAEFYYYLAQEARQGGKQWRALACILKAAILDPEAVLKRDRFFRSTIAVTLSIPFQAIASSLWTPKSWYQFRKMGPLKRKVPSLSELDLNVRPKWNARRGIYERRLSSLAKLQKIDDRKV